jgi:GNAT superfamily N-acetyltransferase
MGREPDRTAGEVRIRAGRADEAEQLRAIAFASKSHWGYNPDWVRRWVEEGGFSLEALRQREIFVAEEDGAIAGWASSIPKGDVCWLEDLWIHPAWIGKGIGSTLWRYVAEQAAARGAHQMEWEAEPNAIGFYERLGGRYLRDSEASEWGRALPVMGVPLERHQPR